MKVAVISLVPTLGKTCLMSVLGGIYSRSQVKSCCILSTGDARDNINIIDVKVRNDDVANPYVFKSMLDSATKGDYSLLDYGIRQGDENVFIYDIMNSVMDEGTLEDFLINGIRKLPADLTLVEICGDSASDFNRKVIKECDCCLVLYDTSLKSFNLLKKFQIERPELQRTSGFVCSQYDGSVISENKMSKLIGVPISNMFFFPYSGAVKRLAVEGLLDRVAYNIYVGDSTTLNLRSRMVEIMQFIFDSPKRKIIRGIDKWSSK